MTRKMFSENVKIEDCGTTCFFCGSIIDEHNKGFMLNVAVFSHWKCLLRLKQDVLDLEKKLNRKRELKE